MARVTPGGLDVTLRRPEPRIGPPLPRYKREARVDVCRQTPERSRRSRPSSLLGVGFALLTRGPSAVSAVAEPQEATRGRAVLPAPLGAGRGPEESGRAPAPAHRALLPRCACIDVRHAQKASRRWTLEMDVALVQYVNRLCRHLAITPARLHPHEVYLDPADAADPRVACLLSTWPEGGRLQG